MKTPLLLGTNDLTSELKAHVGEFIEYYNTE
jgi:hypothetical protein